MAALMKMPRSMRMRLRREFLRVRRDGDSVGGKYLVLAFLRDSDLAGCRFGIITSKRVGKAVRRTRLRRQIRGIIQEFGPDLAAGHYIVTIAKVAAGNAGFEELREEWMRLAWKGGILPRKAAD